MLFINFRRTTISLHPKERINSRRISRIRAVYVCLKTYIFLIEIHAIQIEVYSTEADRRVTGWNIPPYYNPIYMYVYIYVGIYIVIYTNTQTNR